MLGLLAVIPAAASAQNAPASASRFYVVGADGRSAPDPSIRHQRPKRNLMIGAAAPPVQKVPERPPQRQRDPFAEFRCEQFGFYYTLTRMTHARMATRSPEARVVHIGHAGKKERHVSTAARIARDQFDSSVCAARGAANKRAGTGSSNEACRITESLGCRLCNREEP